MSKRGKQAVGQAVRALIFGEARHRDPEKARAQRAIFGKGERADLYKYKGTHCCQIGKLRQIFTIKF